MTRQRTLRTLGAAAIAAVGAVLVLQPAAVVQPEGTILAESASNAVKDSYIVVLKDNGMARTDVGGRAGGLATRYGGKVGFTYRAAFKGFSATMPAKQAKRLAADPAVAFVEQDRGSSYLLRSRSSGSTEDDIDETYTVDLSSEARNGTWKPQVRDAVTSDVGTIDSWSLTL